jgi:hypothetical protein
MAMSRPLVLALIGALLAAATFTSMRAAGDSVSKDDTAAAPIAHPAPGKAAPKAKPDQISAAQVQGAKRLSTRPARPASAARPAKPAAQARAHRPAAKPHAKPTPAKRAVAMAGVPPKVAKALQARQTVVLFFRQPGADDDATQSAVRSVRHHKHVAVFSDGVAHLARYRGIVTGLNITQAPSVVIVGKSRKAVLIEGYIDAGSLNQRVMDAR